MTLPIALPDGWIVLSREVLSLCYQDARSGDDRLAFVLGHELAHLRQDHFWHIKYFQDWEKGGKGNASQHTGLSFEELRHQEFQADTNGILYATMAGFDPQAILPDNGNVNFFQAWINAWASSHFGRSSTSATHPNAAQRNEVLKISLQRVAHQAAAFEMGLWSLYGDRLKVAI